MINDFYFINNLSGWALNFGGTSQKTTDGGHTWIASGSVPNSYAQRIIMIDSLRGWIAAYNNTSGGGNGLGYIYKTTNGGDSWIQEWVTPLVGTDLSDLTVQNHSSLWCVGNNSAIAKYDIPVGIKNISGIVTEFQLYQNYPNPFNPFTRIKFNIAPLLRGVGEARGVYTQLKVYDITGKEVTTLVNETLQPGSYEVTFDGSIYSSGVYYYKLIAGNYVETKKMILLK
jgi:hypothetical protein